MLPPTLLTIVFFHGKVLYPAMMLVGIFRTITVRLRSNETVQFRDISTGDGFGSLALASTAVTSGARSLFSCSDKGTWCTVVSTNEIVQRERNWFRIGFEPLFVDFTQSGVWFIILFLIEVRKMEALVTSSTILSFTTSARFHVEH